ncbi:hypothetical protein ACLVWU_02135 [Bdellovibrio sp. HCB290]|uniref:hypothetical protein n=1 Tax=Bdellovibrio sp. HCB290 TaxID=3394356 RepID=UPI0039B4F7B2
MKKGGLVLLAGCLILGFQNCSQSNLSATELSAPSTHVVLPSDSKSDESIAITSLEIPVPQGVLSVDAKTGRIQLIDRNLSVLEESCLQPSEVAELQSYLKTSNVCGKPAPEEDVMCAQSYNAGYATLILGEQKLNLGESYDSCGRGYKDICGEQASQSFRGLIAYIQKNYHGMLCE